MVLESQFASNDINTGNVYQSFRLILHNIILIIKLVKCLSALIKTCLHYVNSESEHLYSFS